MGESDVYSFPFFTLTDMHLWNSLTLIRLLEPSTKIGTKKNSSKVSSIEIHSRSLGMYIRGGKKKTQFQKNSPLTVFRENFVTVEWMIDGNIFYRNI